MDTCEALSHGIYVVDSGYLRERMDAIYLIVSDGRGAIVESGTAHSLPRVLAALAALGLAVEAVDWLMLTHVHLDHAGGAGALLQALPNARLLVHPRGVRHMVDPSRLWAATVAVYGEAFALREYGALQAVAPERVVAASDGLCVAVGGRRIEVLDTPGHARHHVCYWDELSRGCFSGDAFGLSYRELDAVGRAFMLPATTPSQFDPVAMHASIERLLKKQPECLYLTHYSRVTDVAGLAQDLHRLIDGFCGVANACRGQQDQSLQFAEILAGLKLLVLEEAARAGWAQQGEAALALYAEDLVLNAQGLQGWLHEQV